MGRGLPRLPEADQRRVARPPSVTRRLHDDAFALAEAEAAQSLGLDIDQWDALDEHQRAYALAPALVRAQQKAAACPHCGDTTGACQDPDNQHAFVVTFRRCYRTRAVHEATKARTDMVGVLPLVTLDPSLKKSAQKRGAGRG